MRPSGSSRTAWAATRSATARARRSWRPSAGCPGDAPVTRDLIVEAVDASNDAIGDLITGDDPPGTVAGTTLAGVALVRSDEGEPLWMVFNVGDSRVYAWTDGRLQQVTVDHSAVQELVDQGRMTRAEAERSPVRNLITRAVGSHDEVEADEWLLRVAEHQVFLICSDGLTKELDDEAIAAVLHLSHADGGGVDRAADALVAQALASGGRDNVTVVVIEAHGRGRRPRRADGRRVRGRAHRLRNSRGHPALDSHDARGHPRAPAMRRAACGLRRPWPRRCGPTTWSPRGRTAPPTSSTSTSTSCTR
ncbi:PP2C family protein-serine/threonine phosphatase [Clavibacter zhangzhiyongii]|uniref:PP2C family protein-serine/threonine phosphatase n=1 Tax=Clavibacter zhangzhiyongii TaxID=2768071 RepID=UPI0039E1BFE3